MDCYAGIDVGSTTTKAVVVDGDGVILGRALAPTGVSGAGTAASVLDRALAEAGAVRDNLRSVVATGYGRELVPFADSRVTEITCHARGAFARIGEAFTLIDIGGQDTKAISVTGSGKVERFLMNDRCAAGTGRFLEVMARALETDLAHLAALAIEAEKGVKISSMCTVFAESEVVSLLARGTPRGEIARGLHRGVAERVGGMAKKVGLRGEVYLSGGVAFNPAVAASLGEFLGVEVAVIPEPQLNGAYGAALLALGGA
ncbi:MAG: acyl-CoA dehydratase activase [bacterium]|nr:acyl-CoA dehydratase activase [bacterium]